MSALASSYSPAAASAAGRYLNRSQKNFTFRWRLAWLTARSWSSCEERRSSGSWSGMARSLRHCLGGDGQAGLLATAAQRDRVALPPAPRLLLAGALERPGGGEHVAVGLLGQLAQPGGLVDRIADDGVLEARLRADVAGHGPAGGDPDARLEPVEAGPDPLGQRAPGGERAAGRVVERQRRAEHGQRRVAL